MPVVGTLLLQPLIFLVLSFTAIGSTAASELNVTVSVLRNFRLFADVESQRQHLRDFCRYLRCGSGLATDFNNAPPLCNKIVTEFAVRNSGNACPSGRVLLDADKNHFWKPNDQSLKSTWQSATYTYDNSSGERNKRRIEIEVEDIQPGAVCDVRLSRLQVIIWSRVDGSCANIPPVTIEEADQPLTLHVTAKLNGVSIGTYSKELNLKTIVVVALGDSISSGEGMPHRLHEHTATSPDQWLERRCHRSYYNFSLLALAVAAVQAPLTTFEYINLACSGATINSAVGKEHGGLLSEYSGTLSAKEMKELVEKRSIELRDGNASLPQLKPQIVQAQTELVKFGSDVRPDYVTVSIGGNDLLFGSLVFQSILRKDCKQSWGEWILSWGKTLPRECLFKTVKDKRMSEIDKELAEMVRAINSLRAKNVLLMGYLNPTLDHNGRYCKDEELGDRLLGPKAQAKKGYLVDSSEAEKAYLEVLKPLNDKLAALAKAQPTGAGSPHWRYVDPNVIEKAKMRGWCATPSWFVNYEGSMTKAADHYGTAHPNIYGQNWLSWLVRREFARDNVLDPKLVLPERE